MSSKNQPRGQAIILIAFALVGLIAMVALAIDSGNVFTARRRAQNAVDNAALSAALPMANRLKNDASALAAARATAHSIALDIMHSNGFTDDAIIQINLGQPPFIGCRNETINPVNLIVDSRDKAEYYIQVLIRSNVDTYFGSIIGVKKLDYCVQAIAKAKPMSEMFFGNAVVALKPTGDGVYWMHGTPQTTIEGGGILVNSTSNCAFEAENNALDDFSAPSITVAGTACPDDPAGVPTTDGTDGATQLPPQDFSWLDDVCAGAPAGSRSGDTLSPGRYTGSFPPNGIVRLDPGIYCVSAGNQGFRTDNNPLTGTEVTIVMLSGDVRLNGSGALNLSAPTSGPTKGLLLYLPSSNNSEVTINGNSTTRITGTILAPRSNIVVTGTADAKQINSQLIGYTVELGGTGVNHIFYDDSKNMDEPANVELNK